MDQKWIHILVILAFYQEMTSGAAEEKLVKEGGQIDIKCLPASTGSMVVWFRVPDDSGMEFVGSASPAGVQKSPSSSKYSYSKSNHHILTLKSFTDSDSGIYSCAVLKGSEMNFGGVTRLIKEKVITPQVPTTTTTSIEVKPCTTAAPCVCDKNDMNGKRGETSPSMFCSPIILGPLAGGCGFLLLLLIVTAIYCNKIRTHRCPHHYKRKPRAMAAGKQMMTTRHV